MRLERDVLTKACEPRTSIGSGWEWTPTLFSAFQTPSELILVTTYYPCGSLWDVMNIARTTPSASFRRSNQGRLDQHVLRTLDPSAIQNYASQVALAIGYLHSIGIVHRDIKPHNILIGLNGRAVISDFGSAALLDTSSTSTGKALRILRQYRY